MNKTAARRTPANAAPREPQRLNPGLIVATAMLSAVLGGLALPSFVVIVAGLLPSIVAFVVDDKPGRPLFHTVAPLNVAGVAPFVLKLWLHGHTMDGALAILTNVFDIAVMYGTAALGWVLAWLNPAIAVVVAEAFSGYRLNRLEAREKELRAEWDFEGT